MSNEEKINDQRIFALVEKAFSGGFEYGYEFWKTNGDDKQICHGYCPECTHVERDLIDGYLPTFFCSHIDRDVRSDFFCADWEADNGNDTD